jgi:hypothetical protein
MRKMNLKTALLGITAASALSVGIGIDPAAANPLPFTINPSVLTTGGSYAPVANVGTFQGSSDALITSATASSTTQTESGWVQGTSFQDTLGNLLTHSVTGMDPGNNSPTTYGLYVTYTTVVHGLSFTSPPGTVGTVGAYMGPGTGFSGTLMADIGSNDTYNLPNLGTLTPPTVTDTGGNDDVLAKIYSLAGDAGLDTVTGAAKLDVTTIFVICDGTTNSGYLGGQLIDSTHLYNGANLATGCGGFDARTYFTYPVPFYSLDFASSQNSSITNLNYNGSNAATLNGVSTDVTFLSVPEPMTLSMFGFGLFGLGWFARKRRKTI